MPDSSPPRRFVVGITGASGAAYAQRVIEGLAAADCEVHLTVTPLGRRLLFDELDLSTVDLDALSGGRGGSVVLYPENDLGAAIASGSFRHAGMVIVPASSNTVAAISAGITNHLVQRAAAVTLKERRRLIIAHRETPISLVDLRNMTQLTEAGAIIMPLAPGFYFRPTSVQDIIDFMAAKVLDLLEVEHNLSKRWGEM